MSASPLPDLLVWLKRILIRLIFGNVRLLHLARSFEQPIDPYDVPKSKIDPLSDDGRYRCRGS
jgi:hypothetical protein